jgi:hypothetical protein
VKPAVILQMTKPVMAKPVRKGQLRLNSRRKNTGHGSNVFIFSGEDLLRRSGADGMGTQLTGAGRLEAQNELRAQAASKILLGPIEEELCGLDSIATTRQNVSVMVLEIY